ncbi:MAG: glycosyltransferase family 9 protein [Elusimicrobiota bacterium]|jgi:ADP-heptose:LPS heptosyltransferase|nr:glycosyltransferase family 9 protein [Elusimicrobiota bacterium]
MKKILIIKPSSFGDIIQALPCANALKQIYPDCRITWVVFKHWSAILKLCPDIDEIIEWDRKGGISAFVKTLKFIRKTNFDLIIDLQGLLRSAFLARFAKGKLKIGMPGMREGSGILIKEAYPESAKINASLRNLEPVRFISGKSFKPRVNIEINSSLSAFANLLLSKNKISKKFISLIPFARGKGKDWSVENYISLISLINKKYPKTDIVVLGLQKDYGRFLANNKVIDLCGQTDLLLLAAILSKSQAAIGADTGSMHLACVLNIPSVFIFGNSDIIETSPKIGRFSLLLNKENPKAINDIQPQTVLKEIEILL